MASYPSYSVQKTQEAALYQDSYTPSYAPPQPNHHIHQQKWTYAVQSPPINAHHHRHSFSASAVPMYTKAVTASPVGEFDFYEYICRFGRTPNMPITESPTGSSISDMPSPLAMTHSEPGHVYSQAPLLRPQPIRPNSSSPPPASRRASVNTNLGQSGDTRPTTGRVGSVRNKSVAWKKCQCPGGPPKTHPERHWKNSCPYNPEGSATLACPKCDFSTSGARKDNLQRHLNKKHPEFKLEDLYKTGENGEVLWR